MTLWSDVDVVFTVIQPQHGFRVSHVRLIALEFKPPRAPRFEPTGQYTDIFVALAQQFFSGRQSVPGTGARSVQNDLGFLTFRNRFHLLEESDFEDAGTARTRQMHLLEVAAGQRVDQ